MQKLNSYYYLLIFLASLSFISCGDDPPTGSGNPLPQLDTTAFIYPFTTGSTWNYSRTMTFSDFRPDSIRQYFQNNPSNGSGTMTISSDTIINGITAKNFIDNYNEGGRSDTSRMYYVNTDTALLIIAYRLASSSYIFPKGGKSIRYKYQNKTYSSIYSLFRGAENSSTRPLSDTMIIENPSVQTLKYPVIANTEWVYRYSGQDTLTKKYLNFEFLNVLNQNISCVKTQMKWSSLDNVYIYYHYSKFGKMKTDIFADDMLVTDEFGHELGYVDSKEVTTVTYFNIVNP